MMFLAARSLPNLSFFECGKSRFLRPSVMMLFILSAPWKHIPVTSSASLPLQTRLVSKKWLVRLNGLLVRSLFIMLTNEDTRLCPNLK